MTLIAAEDYDRRAEAELRKAAKATGVSAKKLHLNQAAEMAWLSELARRHAGVTC